MKDEQELFEKYLFNILQGHHNQDANKTLLQSNVNVNIEEQITYVQTHIYR